MTSTAAWSLTGVTVLWAIWLDLWTLKMVVDRPPPTIIPVVLVFAWMFIALSLTRDVNRLRLSHDCRAFTIVSRSRDIAVLVCKHPTCYAVWVTAKTPAGEVLWRRTVFEEVKPPTKTTMTEVQI